MSEATQEALAGGLSDLSLAEVQFSSPTGVTFDADGALIITDRYNHHVRKITCDGKVSTLAGSGTEGFKDGVAGEAQFCEPSGVAVAGDGSVVVVDTGNARIRRISPEGLVSTLAGSGEEGFKDGPAAEAQFSMPSGVAIAKDGSVVVVDTCNARIRKISPEGLVSTLAGSGEEGFKDGAAAEAQFNYPGGVAFDGEGNLFVIDPANARIRKVSPDGQVSTLAGCGLAGFNDGPAAEAEFKFPQSVAVDGDGCLVIVDLGNHRIRKISPDGRVRTLAGTGVEGFADGAVAEAKFAYPQDVAVASDGSLFVADLGNQRIRKISLDGMVSTYAGEGDPLPPEAERERRASLRVRRLSWAALPTPA